VVDVFFGPDVVCVKGLQFLSGKKKIGMDRKFRHEKKDPIKFTPDH